MVLQPFPTLLRRFFRLCLCCFLTFFSQLLFGTFSGDFFIQQVCQQSGLDVAGGTQVSKKWNEKWNVMRGKLLFHIRTGRFDIFPLKKCSLWLFRLSFFNNKIVWWPEIFKFDLKVWKSLRNHKGGKHNTVYKLSATSAAQISSHEIKAVSHTI